RAERAVVERLASGEQVLWPGPGLVPRLPLPGDRFPAQLLLRPLLARRGRSLRGRPHLALAGRLLLRAGGAAAVRLVRAGVAVDGDDHLGRRAGGLRRSGELGLVARTAAVGPGRAAVAPRRRERPPLDARALR